MPEHYEKTNDTVKLERQLIEAHYLGLALRRTAATAGFRHGPATGFVGDMLIGWARFIGGRLLEETSLFAEPAPEPHEATPQRNDRRRRMR